MEGRWSRRKIHYEGNFRGAIMLLSRALEGPMASADAIRSYIITLRTRQDISQEDVADAIGLTRRAYIYWEKKTTRDIKLPIVVKALEAVNGWVGHLGQLATASENEARDLANAWLNLSPKERQAFNDLLSEEAGRQRLIRSALEVTDDPVLQGRLQGYLDGLREEQQRVG